ncbi:MAG: phage major capsid protein [Paracoccaceae bacterium]|nr:phage major capsid protein [Paracoccaceae bacterium]
MTTKIDELLTRQQDVLAEAKAELRKIDDAGETGEAEHLTRHTELLAEFDRLGREIEDLEGDQIDLSRRPTGGTMRSGGQAEEATVGLKPEQRMADWAREHAGRSDFEGLSLGGYLKSMVCGGGSELERRALSEGVDASGGFTVPDILSSRLIDLVRNRTQVIRAGAVTVPLTSDQHYIAKVASDAVPAWRSEAGSVAESDPSFARVELVPRSLAVLTKLSRELMEDTLNLETALPQMLAAAMAVEIDRAALFGSGAAPEPLGVSNTAGIEEVALGGPITSYQPLIDARGRLTANNFAEGPSAFIMNPAEETTVAGLTATDGQPLMPPRVLEGVPMLTTGNVPDGATVSPEDGTMIGGVFRHLLVGMRNDIRILTLRERYADTLELGLIAFARVDFAVEHPGAFVKITGVTQ